MLDLALDVSIVASLRSDLLERSVERPECVAEDGYQRKMRSMGNMAQEHSFTFCPVVTSCFGAWHPVAIREIKKLIRAKCTRLNLDEAKTTAHWRLGRESAPCGAGTRNRTAKPNLYENMKKL